MDKFDDEVLKVLTPVLEAEVKRRTHKLKARATSLDKEAADLRTKLTECTLQRDDARKKEESATRNLRQSCDETRMAEATTNAIKRDLLAKDKKIERLEKQIAES